MGLNLDKKTLIQRINEYRELMSRDDEIPKHSLSETSTWMVYGAGVYYGGRLGPTMEGRRPIESPLVHGTFLNTLAYALNRRSFYREDPDGNVRNFTEKGKYGIVTTAPALVYIGSMELTEEDLR